MESRDAELSYPIGETMERTDYGSNKTNGASSKLENQRWFYDKITKKGAKKVMERRFINGDFMVGKSLDTPNQYIMTVNIQKFHHFPITEMKEGYSVGDNKTSFETIHELVCHLEKNELKTNADKTINLQHSLNKEKDCCRLKTKIPLVLNDKEAETQMRGCMDGDFMIRKTARCSNKYTLTVNKQEFRDINIMSKANLYSIVDADVDVKSSFTSLPELIDHLEKNDFKDDNTSIKLKSINAKKEGCIICCNVKKKKDADDLVIGDHIRMENKCYYHHAIVSDITDKTTIQVIEVPEKGWVCCPCLSFENNIDCCRKPIKIVERKIKIDNESLSRVDYQKRRNPQELTFAMAVSKITNETKENRELETREEIKGENTYLHIYLIMYKCRRGNRRNQVEKWIMFTKV